MHLPRSSPACRPERRVADAKSLTCSPHDTEPRVPEDPPWALPPCCRLAPARAAVSRAARPVAAGAASQTPGDTVLVVVQLAGGNDGLNTVVPYDDDDYGRNRATLRLPAAKLHKIDDLLGFHPELSAMSRLYKEGLLSIVQGVGYPNPEQSHFTAMRAWQTARPREPHCQTGWLGRVVDRRPAPNEPDVPAVFVGQINRPFTLNAERSVVPTLRKLEDATLRTPPGADAEQHRQRLPAAAASCARDTTTGSLDFVAAQRHGRLRHEPADRGRGQATRPAARPSIRRSSSPATLRTIARLIRAELGIRIFHRAGRRGAGRLRQPRRPARQPRRPAAAALRVAGRLRRRPAARQAARPRAAGDLLRVRPHARRERPPRHRPRLGRARVPGRRPRQGRPGRPAPQPHQLENGGPKHHTDFRRVYATVLDRWLGFDSRAILGEKFEALEVIRA